MRYSMTGFRYACTQYLSTLSIMTLRAYGREVGVSKPTEKKKGELIEEIVGILTGDVTPVARATKGAPVKDDFVDPKIERAIEEFRKEFLPSSPQISDKPDRWKPDMIVFRSGEQEAIPEDRIFHGQLEAFDSVPCLMPLDGDLFEERMLIEIEQIRRYNMREGDVIGTTAFCDKKKLISAEIQTINGEPCKNINRFVFETEPSVYPNERLPLLEREEVSSEQKFLDWLLPIGLGQRCLISSPPKAGKSKFLLNVLKSLDRKDNECEVFALLIDQSPELISAYRDILPTGNLIATTYDSDEDMHIFMAEFMLKRMKRFAEMGRNVVLLVDSLSRIARAYNDSEFSLGGKLLPCGLESKTLHYIKKFFGAARKFAKRGSLTMIATVSFGTGDELDDVLYSEISSVAGGEIRLCDELALKRQFPAVDLMRSHFEQSQELLDEQRVECDRLLRQKALQLMALGQVHEMIVSSSSLADLCERLRKL